MLSDSVPAPFEVVSAAVGGGVNSGTAAVVGNDVTVTWTTPLSDGTVGLLPGSTASVLVTVRLPADVSYDANGVPVTNTAVIEGTNFVDVGDSAVVTPVVPLDLGASAGKVFTPDSALAVAGTSVGAALTGGNTANATVDALVVQDPVDPAVAPSPFDYLAFVGFGDVTPPAGTTGTDYEVFVNGVWVLAPGGQLPGGVDPADVKGTRVTFTGDIPAGATGTVELDLVTTELAAAQPDGTVVSNTVQSQVVLGDAVATDTSADDFTLLANDVAVAATKVFDPRVVVAGQSSTVTVSGANASAVPIETLTVREPATGSFPAEYGYGGFSGGITYPAGATSGSVTYTFTDGSTSTVAFADGATPPLPAGEVASFAVTFSGEIVPGGTGTIPFVVETDPDLTGLPVTVPNEVAVEGTNDGVTGSDSATADLYIYDETIETYVSKQIRPAQILAVPGQTTTVTLNGGLTEWPNPPDTTTGTTGNADRIVIQDPKDPVAPDVWWNAFDLTAITQTPIPADSTLTIEYYDTTDGTWKVLSGPLPGPDVYSAAVPADIGAVAGGVRFVYDYTGDLTGFPPGTDLAPNFTSSLRSDGRYTPGPPYSDDASTFVPDCAQTGATSPTPGVADAVTQIPDDECPPVELVPTDPGTADLVDKEFGTSSSGGGKSVIARSGDTIPSTVRWSTGGYSGFDRVEITDIADPAGTPVAQSLYEAFNLTRVEPITPATDPFIRYDQVSSVQLWTGTAWVDATNDPCPSACVGQFPGMDLTAAEQETALGVRLVFVESPDRAAASAGDLDAPPVGSGVARSTENARPVTFVWQVRDTRRSDGTPVLGEFLYNLAQAGLVRNTVGVVGYPTGQDPVGSTDVDDVLIVDVPITTTTDKLWEGGPVAAPDDPDVPENQFPSSRIVITTRNTTPARVDQMVITDTAPGSVNDRTDDPFQAFRLTNFAEITEPAGTQNTVVTLSCPDGSAPTFTRAEALALTPATMPCDVTGVRVAFDGRIAADTTGVVAFDLRLRPYWRGTTDRVTSADSPTGNTALGVVADVDTIAGCPPPPGTRYACDQGTAEIVIADAGFMVTAGKSINPPEQEEGDFAPVTVRVSVQNSGATNPFMEMITDDDASFWNAVDFVGMEPSWALPAPVERVRACYLDGGDFTADTVENDTAGGTWTCGSTADQTLAAAVAFMAAAPPTLHGVRFIFTASDETGWQNPTNPVIEVPFQVQRRVGLRSGGPVPTDRSDQTPAPGEQGAGVFVDTVDVAGDSVLIGPDLRLTDTDSADAPYRHVHLPTGVTVVKEPGGDVPPGEVIPYTLSFTNTGRAPLTNPVFSDELPTDAQGPLLVLDPDRDPTVSPYSFTLTGAAPTPPNGAPLPTDPGQVDIEEGDTIVFRMPPGSVLEPGQTYTITAELVLRPGLTDSTEVRNAAVIDADEPFDTCQTTLDPTGACRDDTVVRPLAAPALSTVKYVKADEPPTEPGVPQVISTVDGFPCDADADGFYRTPCVPVTLPGDTETWRFTVTNSGTLPIDRLVAMDNLPVPGDQGVIVMTPRGSEWPVTFVGDVELITSAGTETAVLTTSYSTATQPCTADLDPLGPQCPAGSWLPLDGTVDPAVVRSLKFQVDFAGDLFNPGETVTLQFRTRTTPTDLRDTDYPIAWNTVADGGTAVSGAGPVVVPATEGRRVGVAYPTGSILIRKVVEGPGAAFAPEEFTVQLTCTVAGDPVTGLPLLVLVPGAAPTRVDGLPYGAECTATETDQGQDDTIVDTAVVGGELGLVTVTNVFETGDLSITKTVGTTAVDQSGNPVPYGPFELSVTCVFTGNPVYADGYGPDRPMVKEVVAGETWVLTGLPAGARCTVTETDTAGAVEVNITPGDGVDVAVGTPVAVENVYTTGSIGLRKVVTGPGAADFGAGPFTVRVVCVLDDASGRRTVYDGDVVLGGAQPFAAQVDDLATGAVCTVTEADPGGAQAVEISPDTVTVGTGDVAEVVVTNTFETGALTVVKTVDGPGATRYGAGPFEVTLTCVRDGSVETPIPGGAVRTLDAANGYRATYSPLLLGSVCTVEETRTGGANRVVVGEAATVAEATEVAVVNTFLLGSVRVTKRVVGDGAGPFTVRLACTRDVDGTRVPVEIPRGADRTIAAGATVTYDELPVGAVCAVTEPDAGGAADTAITPAVVVGDGAGVEVVNTFTGGGLAATGVSGLLPVGATGLALLVVGGVLFAVGRLRRNRR